MKAFHQPIVQKEIKAQKEERAKKQKEEKEKNLDYAKDIIAQREKSIYLKDETDTGAAIHLETDENSDRGTNLALSHRLSSAFGSMFFLPLEKDETDIYIEGRLQEIRLLSGEVTEVTEEHWNNLDWRGKLFVFLNNPNSSKGYVAGGVAVFPLQHLQLCFTILMSILGKISLRAKYCSIVIMILILTSSVAFMTQTLPRYKTEGGGGESEHVFDWIEYICIVAFTIEYFGRLATCHSVDPETMSGRSPQLKEGLAITYEFAKEPLNIIDLLAILPFYVEIALSSASDVSTQFSMFRILRLARVFRVFKLGKYSSSMQMFGRVLQKSRDAMFLLVFFVAIAVVIFGSMIYFAEGGTYDEESGLYLRWDVTGSNREETPFSSIPASFYWVVVTTTTLGYGDYVPTSIAGKFVAAVTMHLGILVLALPITVIGTHFNNEYESQKAMEQDKEAYARESALERQLLEQELEQRKLIREWQRGGCAGPCPGMQEDDEPDNDEDSEDLIRSIHSKALKTVQEGSKSSSDARSEIELDQIEPDNQKDKNESKTAASATQKDTDIQTSPSNSNSNSNSISNFSGSAGHPRVIVDEDGDLDQKAMRKQRLQARQRGYSHARWETITDTIKNQQMDKHGSFARPSRYSLQSGRHSTSPIRSSQVRDRYQLQHSLDGVPSYEDYQAFCAWYSSNGHGHGHGHGHGPGSGSGYGHSYTGPSTQAHSTPPLSRNSSYERNQGHTLHRSEQLPRLTPRLSKQLHKLGFYTFPMNDPEANKQDAASFSSSSSVSSSASVPLSSLSNSDQNQLFKLVRELNKLLGWTVVEHKQDPKILLSTNTNQKAQGKHGSSSPQQTADNSTNTHQLPPSAHVSF